MIWSNIDINNIEDGVYYDMPIEVYHGNRTHLSASSIKECFKSLAHFKSYLETPKIRKNHLDFGNAFELSLTDFYEYEEKVSVFDPKERPVKDKDFRVKKNKEWKENFYSENKSKLIIPRSGSDSEDILLILKNSFYKHETAKTLVTNANYQTTIFWTCKNTGLKLKTRPDFWKKSLETGVPIITDLKTDKDTTADKHIKSICNNNYPIQAIMQLDGLWQSGLIDSISVARYFWVFCCKNPPYNTEVYEFDSSDVESFLDAYRFKLEEIKRAYDKELFLSYDPFKDNGIRTVSFPFYYKNNMGIHDKIDS
ncbi:conserved protein of unknown function [Tenacibaculum sp. 190524A02b]|uniref:PD-(D/E)XK nuclease-like domain-containing protein n=1 Tax=Tenacibaculum vairaonense TaxID=3137860 RepID=UPI0032B2D157